MMRQNKILKRGASSPTQARLFHSPSSHVSTLSVCKKIQSGERSKFRHRRAHLITSYRTNWLEFFVACVEFKVSFWRKDLLNFVRRCCSRERRQRAVAVEQPRAYHYKVTHLAHVFRSRKMSSEPLSNGNAPMCPAKILKSLPNVMPTDFVRPDLPSRCTWTKVKGEQPPSPHTKRPL